MQRLLTGVNWPLPYLFPCQSTKIMPCYWKLSSCRVCHLNAHWRAEHHGLGEGDASFPSLVVSLLEVNAFASADFTAHRRQNNGGPRGLVLPEFELCSCGCAK
ncbi:hypothetical protein FVEG_15052 [Fusarium verticillioides 7600]|uniref:Uncharacterized protein n=1 Tax=Gibberella moniliformis (strain M3125 / FGSC 7600) TaxID=334819 RepID=W7LJS3_GIBM7|nr:hypothetical protein FVEG_15052 [Fusarium verticillioides 7600]EWG39643.1 hypothetical protein FVEG_15052 [Fusarium verticillioides 7600]